MEVPFLDLKKEYLQIKEQIDSEVLNIIASGNFILGNKVNEFEKNIGQYLNQSSLGCASGTDALLMALLTLKIGPGDEVITTPFTFFATAGAIARVGAKPVFVDIDRETLNLNVDLIENKININTKAIIPVHLFGRPVDMDLIMSIAQKKNINVIEDACQAIGAEYKSKKIGTIGDFGCFSFFPTKNLGGFGDGGLITCKNTEHFSYLKKLRVHGSEKKYIHEFVGINSRLDAIQAAILNIKLKSLDEKNKRRKKIAEIYNKEFSDILEVPLDCNFGTHIYHQYSVLTDKRDSLLKYLESNKIAAGIYYPLPLHLQQSFNYLGYKNGDLPVSENVSNQILSLPIYPEMSEDEIHYVIEKVQKFFN